MPQPEPSLLPGGHLAIDDHAAPIYSVGQVADLLGLQPAFVRRLDTEQVVQPARSPGGQRRYSRDEVAAVQAVWKMSGEGMTLAGIKRILVLEAEVKALNAQVANLKRRLSRAHD